MPFDSEWPGDAIAAPFCGTSNREDASSESPGSRTWDRLGSRSGANEPRSPRDGIGIDKPTETDFLFWEDVGRENLACIRQLFLKELDPVDRIHPLKMT